MCKYSFLSLSSTFIFIPSSLNKTLKLFVAGYDGMVCVYEVNTMDGGECKQISQYLLFSMSPNQPMINNNTTAAGK